jgi:glycosyltransferase involved in cell wall biosynthesis
MVTAIRPETRLAVNEPSQELELSILMPCLNEAETLATCITKARGYLQRAGIDGEVLIADNGSTDGSQEIARSHGARVVHVPAKGYGAALLGGIAAARGRYVIMGDADDSYDFERLDRFVEKLREGFDLVMGNRFAGGIAPGAMPPLHRYLGNPVLSFIGRLFFKSPIRDFHCGMRGFRRDAMAGLDLRTTGMEFASEMIVKSTYAELKIAEVPTTLSPDGRSRPPHLRSWRDGWRHLRFLLMFSPRWLFLFPGFGLFMFGLVTFIAVLPGPLQIGSVRFDVHTLLLSSSALLVGSQIVILFLLAKQFATNNGLIPVGENFLKYRRWMTLERGVVLGAVLTVLGLAGSVYAVIVWAGRGFGALDYSSMMRLVVPSITLLALGVQVIMLAFLSSILDLSLRSR